MLASKGITIPKKTSLYKYRISIDLATILWARRHRFGLDRPFYVHCRLDASLQYGKDYFMSEADIVYPEGINSWQDVSREGTLYTRLLVGQTLGARASGVAVKTKKLLHQLALELCPDYRFVKTKLTCENKTLFSFSLSLSFNVHT